jgi:hypothetical protein
MQRFIVLRLRRWSASTGCWLSMFVAASSRPILSSVVVLLAGRGTCGDGLGG